MLLALSFQGGSRQDEILPSPVGESAPESSSTDPSAAVVTVDGFVITEGDVEQRFQTMLVPIEKATRRNGESLRPDNVARFREESRDTIVEALIEGHLLDRESERVEVSVTDQEVRAFYEKNIEIRTLLISPVVTVQEFLEQVEAATGMTLEETLAYEALRIRHMLLAIHLIEALHPAQCEVAEEEIRASSSNTTTDRRGHTLAPLASKPEGATRTNGSSPAPAAA